MRFRVRLSRVSDVGVYPAMRKKSKPRAKNKQRTYYVGAEYIEHGDRDAAAWRGRASISNLLRINVSPGK